MQEGRACAEPFQPKDEGERGSARGKRDDFEAPPSPLQSLAAEQSGTENADAQIQDDADTSGNGWAAP